MPARVLTTMVTTTSYGSWLPGDLRGYVQDGRILPANPALLNHSKSIMSGSPVYFGERHQVALFAAMQDAAREFGYTLADCSVESWHLHWLVAHGYDAVPTMVGRLKNRMRQALNVGRIWTEGYYARCLFTDRDIEEARRYIAGHEGCRMTNGVILPR